MQRPLAGHLASPVVPGPERAHREWGICVSGGDGPLILVFIGAVRRGRNQGNPTDGFSLSTYFRDICILAGAQINLAETRLRRACASPDRAHIREKNPPPAVSAAAEAAPHFLGINPD